MRTKAALRAEIRGRRAARTQPERAAAERALADVVLAERRLRAARRVACYVSAADEPGTGVLRARLRAAGTEVLLPVVDGDTLDWAPDDDVLQPGPYGLPEPTAARLGPHAPATCDVLLLPALAADRAGTRLGQGAGFYDRSLATLPPGRRGLVVALLHDDELLPAGAIAREPHDVPVDAVATPSGWLDLS